MIKTLLAVILTGVSALGAALPEDRMPSNLATPATPWYGAGVQGGIPTYTNAIYFKEAYGADNTGVTNCSALLSNAVAACPNGGAIFITNGLYNLAATILIDPGKQIVIRGNGPTSTVLSNSTLNNSYRGSIAIGHVGYTLVDQYKTITSADAVRGTNVVTFPNVTGLTAPYWGYLVLSNDPPVIVPGQSDCPTCFKQFQIFHCTNISGNTLTIEGTWSYNYTNQQPMSSGRYPNLVQWCGVEDLGMVGSTNLPDAVENAVTMYYALNCWVKNVRSRNTQHAHVSFNNAIHCEVRECDLAYHVVYDSDARYGVQFTGASAYCLAEDNILNGHNLAGLFQQGAHFNVAGYNFLIQAFGNGYPSDATGKGGWNSHGDNANFNLTEGNIWPWREQDNYFGSTHHETDYRSWNTDWSEYDLSGTNISNSNYRWQDCATNRYHNSSGVILGTARNVGGTTGYKFGYDKRTDIFVDTNSQYTAFIEGVVDRFDGSTTWSTNADHTLPASYYLLSKPAWFQALDWPAIGPDVNTSPNITNYLADPIIPARARYYGVPYSGPSTYYVATNGSDANPGTAGSPWLTIQHAVDTIASGDTVSVGPGVFGRVAITTDGVTVVGTGSPGALQTVVDPSLLVTNGWVAASEVGGGCYKHTGLPFETKNLMVGDQRVLYLQTTNDISSGMNNAYTSSGITKGSTLLASSSSLVLTSAISGQAIDFWASVGALWASTNGVTYLRFANGADPNGVSVRLAGNLDGSWTDDVYSNAVKVAASGVTLRNLDLRGAWCGALMQFSSNTVLDGCLLEGGRYRAMVNVATNTVMTNCTLTTAYYGYSDPGAWQGKTNTGNRENLYLVAKFLSGMESLVVSDTGVLAIGANGLDIRNCTFSKNIGDNVWVGDAGYPVQSVTISSNSFANSSAHGVFYLPGETNTVVVGNAFSDINVHHRFQNWDNGDARTIKIYRNTMWEPAGVGEAFFAHYDGLTPTVWPLAWVYWNSVSGGLCGLDSTPTTATGMNGTVFVNNLISGAQWLLTSSMAFCTNADQVGAWDWNLVTPPAVTYPTNTAGVAWFGANNVVALATEWDTNTVTNFQLPAGSLAIDGALDLTVPFTLRGTNYSALPNTAVTKTGSAWDIGAKEYVAPASAGQVRVRSIRGR